MLLAQLYIANNFAGEIQILLLKNISQVATTNTISKVVGKQWISIYMM